VLRVRSREKQGEEMREKGEEVYGK